MLVLLMRSLLADEPVAAAAETAPQEVPAAVAAVPDAAADAANAATPEVPPEPKKSDGVSFFGAATIEFLTKPTTSENNSANASLGFGFGGSARNAAETYARIGDEKNKLFTLVGDDSLGQVMKSDLLKKRVNINFVETDQKLPTASRIVMQIEEATVKNLTGQPAENATEPEKKEEGEKKKIPKKSSNLTQIVQYNHDILHRVAYKYLYPQFKNVNESEFIYADMMVNENAIKGLMNNFGSKLYLHAADAQNLVKYMNIIKAYQTELAANKKKVESKFLAQGLYMTLAEVSVVPSNFCENLNFKEACKTGKALDIFKVLGEDFLSQKKKQSYADYLLKVNESVKEIFEFLHTVTKAQHIFVRIPGAGIIVSVAEQEISYSENNCGKGCIVSDAGSDEAFLAGFLFGKVQQKRLDDCLEVGQFVMITALQTEAAVNQNLDEGLLKKISSTNFVSYRVIHAYHAETIDGAEVKADL